MIMMARYPDDYFELAIVDPPYGIGADKAQNAAADKRKNAKGNSKAGRGWKEYKVSDWDNETPTDEYFDELFRVSKKQIIWGGNYFKYIWNYSNSFLIWNKMQRDFSLADGELAWYSETNKAMRTFDFSRGGALANNNKNGGRFHPTQKPVKLYEWLLMNYAKEGDKILDTHRGSASLDIACHNLGFDLVTCELDTDYFNDGNKRLKQHQQQLTMF
jgi:site-specific DNA-methyltransferase (adenine-specific)